jgi:hypothetical protein
MVLVIYVLILTKNWLGSSLGDFFTNSSGSPWSQVMCQGPKNVTSRSVCCPLQSSAIFFGSPYIKSCQSRRPKSSCETKNAQTKVNKTFKKPSYIVLPTLRNLGLYVYCVNFINFQIGRFRFYCNDEFT